MGLKTFTVCAVIAGAVAAAVYGCLVEPESLRLEKIAIPVSFLPEHLNGFTIGVLADMHLNPRSVKLTRKAALLLARENPDLVVIPGDLIKDRECIPLLQVALEPLTGTAGSFPDPTTGKPAQMFAVPGNWDPWLKDRRYAEALPFKVLCNQGLLAAPGLWLAGIDDGLLGDPDIDQALAGAPEDAVRVLLAHEPDLADVIRPDHRIALQISGHTHGGQVRLPLIGTPVLPPLGRNYRTGLDYAGSTPVYTSRGIGASHLRIRFLSPPEVTIIRLAAPTDHRQRPSGFYGRVNQLASDTGTQGRKCCRHH